MCVHRGIAGCSGQVLSISVRDVLTGLRVAETLGQAEINDVDIVLFFANADQEIVRLDVTVEKVT